MIKYICFFIILISIVHSAYMPGWPPRHKRISQFVEGTTPVDFDPEIYDAIMQVDLSNTIDINLPPLSNEFVNIGFDIRFYSSITGKINIIADGTDKFYENNVEIFDPFVQNLGIVTFVKSVTECDIDAECWAVQSRDTGIELQTFDSGLATLNNAGVRVVTTKQITDYSKIFLTVQNGGPAPAGRIYVSARVVGTSFTITSTSGATDENVVVAWELKEIKMVDV